MKFAFYFLAIILSLCLQTSCFAMTPTTQMGQAPLVKLEIADTPEKIQRGLMKRTSLAEDSGMVFLFHPYSKVKFWMYHCFIPLDMVFIKDGKIVKIFENVPPYRSEDKSLAPTYPQEGEGIEVSEVVEVNAGFAKKHGLKEGDPVSFNLPGEKK